MNHLFHCNQADAGISPTKWQASTFPSPFNEKISVIHDGIDTKILAPDKSSNLVINNARKFTSEDEIITFVNRNLEPYRGYHIFMRSLPKIFKEHPDALVVIVGGEHVSYGKKPKEGTTWRNKQAG